MSCCRMILSSRLGYRRTYGRFSLISARAQTTSTQTWTERLLDKDASIATKDFKSRWLMVLPACATHMCLGAPWAFSAVADVLTRNLGFVAPCASDWVLAEAAFPISIVFLMQGVTAGMVGGWQMEEGTRKSLLASAVLCGTGFSMGAGGIALHSLPLLYAGFGVVGASIGLGYTPPLQALLNWFPDRKGVASGLIIASFGSGALIFSPAVTALMDKFKVLPEYLGKASDISTELIDGRLYARVQEQEQLVEVVRAGAQELAKLPYSMEEGIYVVGSGSTGAVEALAVMGAAYFSVIAFSAFSLYRPHPSVAEDFLQENRDHTLPVPVPVPSMSLAEAMRSPNFYFQGVTFFCLATGGLAIFSVAKPLMNDVFSCMLPAVVTSAFASKYLMMLSGGNLAGRLGFGAFSDYIGRKQSVAIFTMVSVPLYFALPSLVAEVVATGSVVPMYFFCGATTMCITMMGGMFSVLPAYEAEVFGTKSVGAIHGRMLLWVSAASLVGPQALFWLRSASEKKAVTDLVSMISPESFERTFGAPIEQAFQLLETKTLSINKLLVLAPPGTLDPTPYLYDTTMYSLSALMLVSVGSNLLVRLPLPPPPVTVIAAVASVRNSGSDSGSIGAGYKDTLDNTPMKKGS